MKIKPLNIGSLKVDFPVMLSPMAGYTDSAFRSLCMDFKCGMTYTEVITSRGVVHGSKLTKHMLETSANENPLAGHIYGSEPEIMARAAAEIEKLERYSTIDINCGCPVRKIVTKGAGAALMHNPQKIATIVSAVKNAVSLPVTIKTRLGPHPQMMNISEIAHAAEEAGADAIAIHARFASDKHSGSPNWNALAEIKSALSIPVLGNGGINNADDALRMLKETKVDGILIGRAAIGNPWIFEEIYHLANGLTYRPHSLKKHKQILIDHLDKLIAVNKKHPKYSNKPDDLSDAGAVRRFRGHLFRYLSGFYGWNKIKRNLNSLNSRNSVIEAIDVVLRDNSRSV